MKLDYFKSKEILENGGETEICRYALSMAAFISIGL